MSTNYIVYERVTPLLSDRRGRFAPTRVTRFDVIMDPTDRFVVWDGLEGCPAMENGELLVFDTRDRANRVMVRLNGCTKGSVASQLHS